MASDLVAVLDLVSSRLERMGVDVSSTVELVHDVNVVHGDAWDELNLDGDADVLELGGVEVLFGGFAGQYGVNFVVAKVLVRLLVSLGRGDVVELFEVDAQKAFARLVGLRPIEPRDETQLGLVVRNVENEMALSGMRLIPRGDVVRWVNRVQEEIVRVTNLPPASLLFEEQGPNYNVTLFGGELGDVAVELVTNRVLCRLIATGGDAERAEGYCQVAASMLERAIQVRSLLGDALTPVGVVVRNVEGEFSSMGVPLPDKGELLRHFNRMHRELAVDLSLSVPPVLDLLDGDELWGGEFGDLAEELATQSLMCRLLTMLGDGPDDKRRDAYCERAAALRIRVVGARDLGVVEGTGLGEVVRRVEEELGDLGLPLPDRKRLLARINEAQLVIARDLDVPQVYVENVPAGETVVLPEGFRPDVLLRAEVAETGQLLEVITEDQAARRGVKWQRGFQGFPSVQAAVGNGPFVVFSPGNWSATRQLRFIGVSPELTIRLRMVKFPTVLSFGGEELFSFTPFDGVLESWGTELLALYVKWLFVKDSVDWHQRELARGVYEQFLEVRGKAFAAVGRGELYSLRRPVLRWRHNDLVWRVDE